MSDYVIVSDATFDLPVQMVEEYGISVIPMGVEVGNVEYFHYPDERELSIEKFYSQLKSGVVSHTTQITPSQFIDFFTPILDKGMDILYIAFSSGLSGTYHAARLVIEELAEKYPDRKIYCVDSLCASLGEGFLVYNAALQKRKGLDIDELRDWTQEHKTMCRHWFTVKDLFHLKRGGRVTSVEAVVGTALRIRPVLSTDEQGKLVVISKVRGIKAEIELLVSKMESEGIDLSDQTIFVGHGDNLKQAMEIEKIIRSKNLVKDVVITKVGPIIGTHTGPGMLAIVYMGKKV